MFGATKAVEQPKVYKYYLEVIGGQKELYTVTAHEMEIVANSYGCYIFRIDEKMIASYPINKTIIKSIEEK